MWPFSVLRRHKHERRYRAARLVMLGRYTYARLTPDERRAVRDRDRQYLLTTGAAWAAKWHEKFPERFSLSYVVAMKSLGIPPAVTGERWDIPDNVVINAVPVGKALVARPMTVGSASYRVARFVFQLYSNYRYADSATEAARLDLVARGADIPAVDLESLNQRVVGPGGRIMTLRERWLQLWPPDRS